SVPAFAALAEPAVNITIAATNASRSHLNFLAHQLIPAVSIRLPLHRSSEAEAQRTYNPGHQRLHQENRGGRMRCGGCERRLEKKGRTLMLECPAFES